MNEKNEISQMAPENIRADRERISNLVYVQFHRIGSLVASSNQAIIINWGVRDSLEFIDALLIAYADDEYIEKIKIIKTQMDSRVRTDKHSGMAYCPSSLMKFKSLNQHEPRKYYSYCMEWLREMNGLLQRSGFTEAGRGTFTIPERIEISNKENLQGLELVSEEE